MIIYTWVDWDGNQRWSRTRPRHLRAQISSMGGVYRNGSTGGVWGGRGSWFVGGTVGECLQQVYGGAK